MGFYNIMLEGEQAEAYKAKKAKEAEENEKAEAERVAKRNQAGVKTQDFEDKFYEGDSEARKDHNRFIDARKVVLRDEDKRASNWRNTPMRDTKKAYTDDRDAVNRHMRRHPDQWDGDKRIKSRSESGIFESVEFLHETSLEDVDKAGEEVKKAEADMNKTRDQAMSSIRARHAEFNQLLNRLETRMKNSHETTAAQQRDIDETLARMSKDLDSLLK